MSWWALELESELDSERLWANKLETELDSEPKRWKLIYTVSYCASELETGLNSELETEMDS